MKKNGIPWSYSSLTSFETCPKRYYHTRVAKDTPDPPGEQAVWGQTVHKYLEDRVALGTPLPAAVAQYEPLVLPVVNSPGKKLVEQQLAVAYGLTPTEWDSPDAWSRGIIDLGVVSPNGAKATLLDWKTGRRKADSDQLMLFAGLAFSHYKELKTVTTGFIWLKDSKIDTKTFKREEVPVIWQKFIPRVLRLQRAYEETRFPPKPSGLCERYCPVPHRLCHFSGKHRNGNDE